MYCETQPRYAGKSWMELFPDDAFPNDTPEDKARSKCHVHACIYIGVHDIVEIRLLSIHVCIMYLYMYTLEVCNLCESINMYMYNTKLEFAC